VGPYDDTGPLDILARCCITNSKRVAILLGEMVLHHAERRRRFAASADIAQNALENCGI
jgi:hypothetical protein